MAEVIVETTEVVSLEEQLGVIVGLELEHIVTGLTATTAMAKLNDALTAVNSYNPPLDTKIIGGTLSDLKLISRKVNLLSIDHTKAKVRLKYQRKESQNQLLDETENLIISISSSLNSKETALDKDGNQIEVSYTITSPEGSEPQTTITKTQGATISVDEAQEEVSISGYWKKTITEAHTIARALINKINSTTWLDGDAGTWKCTATVIEPKATKPGGSYYGQLVYIDFRFQYDPNGWQPKVTYVDPATDRPPSGLTEGQGIKTVEWYEQADFNAYFPL